MKKSKELKLDDVREVFRILQEAVDLGNDPVAWRLHMIERIRHLIDSNWGVSFNIPMEFDPKNLKPPMYVYSPLPKKEEQVFIKYISRADASGDPLSPVIRKLSDRPVTMRRRDLVDDKTWYNSEHYKTVRTSLGIDDLIHAHDPLPQYRLMTVLGFTRRIGEKPFRTREVKIVDLLRSELRHRWISSNRNPEPAKLSPGLSQLLAHLKGSMSEKEIARYMGLSVHTTHNYVKALYKRLGVSSRTELVHQNLTSQSAILPRIG